ncbi:MAG: lysozyme [Rickettsiales bacterium]|jgi:GH24 family phage-related lysozyme (muramidase)|nr:lysozyme [Rickettsiales bacterium]
MKTSKECVAYLKGYERFSATPYDDGAGVMTIGYGHAIKKGERFDAISESQAADLFARDLEATEDIVNRCARNLTQSQFDALASLAYNIGPDAFAKSTLVSYLNGGATRPAYPTTESAFKAFDKASNPKTGRKETMPGLVNRRADDWNIYANGKYNVKRG